MIEREQIQLNSTEEKEEEDRAQVRAHKTSDAIDIIQNLFQFIVWRLEIFV